MKSIVLLFAAMLIAGLVSTTFAAILYVGPKETYKTIQAGVDAAKPSDTVIVRDGVYTDRSQLYCPVLVNVTHGGTDEKHRITIKAEHKWGAVLDGQGEANALGIRLGEGVSYVTVQDFEIKNCGTMSTSEDYGNNWGVGISFYGKPEQPRLHNVIKGNLIHHCDLGIDDCATSEYYTIDGNVFHHIGGEYHRHPIYFTSNNGIITNNIFHDTIEGYPLHFNQSHQVLKNILISNNTFVRGTRSSPLVFTGDLENITIQNNIFYAPPSASPAIEFYVRYLPRIAENLKHITVRNNLLFGRDAALFNPEVEALITQSGNLTADPKFVNPTPGKDNYHLRPSSPAIGTGCAALAPDHDAEGKARQGRFDIGAYQAGGNDSRGAEWYVSPKGTVSGDGSKAKPWPLRETLEKPNPKVKPGDTLWLRGGTYKITGGLISRLAGTAEAPIKVRQYPGERAIVATEGGSYEKRFSIQGNYTWYWGFEITRTSPVRYSPSCASGERACAAHLDGDFGGNPHGIRFINLIVHDVDHVALAFNAGGDANEIYGCLIYNNGFDAPDRGHGHAIYLGNRGVGRYVTDNIIFNQYSYGIHAYAGSKEKLLDNCDVGGNIVFNNGCVSTVSGITSAILFGGENEPNYDNIHDNYCYNSPVFAGGTGLRIGYQGESQGCSVRDNYVATTTAIEMPGAKGAKISGNTFIGQVVGFDPKEYPENNYFTQPLGEPEGPKGVHVFVRPNAYESGRANIAVFNWDSVATIQVDLSKTGLKVGEHYEVRDAQNFFGAPIATGIYKGGSSTLPLPDSSFPVAQVVGTPARQPAHTTRDFNAFVLLPTTAGTQVGK